MDIGFHVMTIIVAWSEHSPWISLTCFITCLTIFRPNPGSSPTTMSIHDDLTFRHYINARLDLQEFIARTKDQIHNFAPNSWWSAFFLDGKHVCPPSGFATSTACPGNPRGIREKSQVIRRTSLQVFSETGRFPSWPGHHVLWSCVHTGSDRAFFRDQMVLHFFSWSIWEAYPKLKRDQLSRPNPQRTK